MALLGACGESPRDEPAPADPLRLLDAADAPRIELSAPRAVPVDSLDGWWVLDAASARPAVRAGDHPGLAVRDGSLQLAPGLLAIHGSRVAGDRGTRLVARLDVGSPAPATGASCPHLSLLTLSPDRAAADAEDPIATLPPGWWGNLDGRLATARERRPATWSAGWRVCRRSRG